MTGEVAKYIATLLPLVIGILGVGGLVFTALRFRRDDTTAIVTQQSTILNDMKSLNAELRSTADSLRGERDQLRTEVGRLTDQVQALRTELGTGNEKLSGQVHRIQQKLEENGE